MFRVVPDQLRISEGWVRCGHCDEVFDANAHLRSLDEAALRPHSEPTPESSNQPESASASAAVSTQATTESVTTHAPFTVAVDTAPEWATDPDPLQPQETDATGPAPSDTSATAKYRPNTDPFLAPIAHGDDDAEAQWAHTTLELPVERLAQDDIVLHDHPPLSFMPRGDGQSADGRRSGNKGLLWACTLLGLVLTVQLVMKERDYIAATAPALRPLLVAGCSWLACTISAPQQIDAIAIDSSAFTSLKAGVYVLSASLKNTASVELAAPALELTLTDIQDRPLLRKVVMPADLATKPLIGAGSELHVSLPMSVQASAESSKIAGYKLLAFYP
jgi:predicted Zn finger-like uncharacterized protein